MASIIYEMNTKLNEAIDEAYKVLRTNIQFCQFDKKIKTITITSYSPGEGKTTTSLNLAISMAKSGMNVLLIDADLRKPMALKALGRNDFKGLSNYILGRTELNEIINSTNIEGFQFITCGVKPINPTELLSSVRFNELLTRVKNQYDMVIIDTPPLGSVIDCAIIAAQTDGTIIVIEQNTVKLNNAIQVREQLKKVNARILGVVLNKVNKSDYRNYFSGYDYYGSQKKYAESFVNNFKKDKKV